MPPKQTRRDPIPKHAKETVHSVAIPNLQHANKLNRFLGYTELRDMIHSAHQVVRKSLTFEDEMELQRIMLLWRYKKGLTVPEIEQRLKFHPNPYFKRTMKQIWTFFWQCDEKIKELDDAAEQ